MARIQAGEYNTAQLNNIEKVNKDYFLKVITADSEGNFLNPFIPQNYDEIQMSYDGNDNISEVVYKLNGTTLTTLTLTYNGDNRLTGVSKS